MIPTHKFVIMTKYTHFVVDATWVLTRGWHALGKRVTVPNLVKNFIQQVVKNSTNLGEFERVVLLWDGYPYHKFNYLQSYKSNRVYISESDLENENLTDEERESIKFELHRKHIKTLAKRYIINELEDYGMASFRKTGYEADDLAFFLSKNLVGTEYRALLYASDSDWGVFCNSNTDHFRPIKNNTSINTYNKIEKLLFGEHKDMFNELEITPKTYVEYIQAASGTHNNLVKVHKSNVNSDTWKVVVPRLIEDPVKWMPHYLNDIELFKKQLRSFDCSSFPEADKAKKMMYYAIKGTGKVPEFHDIQNKFNPIESSTFTELMMENDLESKIKIFSDKHPNHSERLDKITDYKDWFEFESSIPKIDIYPGYYKKLTKNLNRDLYRVES